MRKYLIAVAMLVTLSGSVSAQLNPQQQRMKDCNTQASGMSGERAQAVHEFMPKRVCRRHKEGELRQRQAMREFLHRQGQGLSQVKRLGRQSSVANFVGLVLSHREIPRQNRAIGHG